jgi:uncharacterized membrane protein YgaE (UPF0421/DUF939 family)
MNLYMPSLDRKLAAYRKKIESCSPVNKYRSISAKMTEKLSSIFFRYAASFLSRKEIPETHQMIQEAKNLAYRDVQNHILRHENLYYHILPCSTVIEIEVIFGSSRSMISNCFCLILK